MLHAKLTLYPKTVYLFFTLSQKKAHDLFKSTLRSDLKAKASKIANTHTIMIFTTAVASAMIYTKLDLIRRVASTIGPY